MNTPLPTPFRSPQAAALACGLAFAASATPVNTLSAQESEPAPLLTGVLTESSMELTIETSSTGLNHWRIDGSESLSDWSVYATTEVLNGSGTTVVEMPTGSQPSKMFFRAVLDNSVSNVLELPDSTSNYANIILPPHLRTAAEQEADNTPSDNPVTDAGAELGRVLFYDKKLSRNYTVSCASCHLQEHGFSDPDAFSIGFEGGLTGRNSMGLANAKFYGSGHFFWDERAETLEVQALMPIQDGVEMGMDLPTLVTRLQGYTYYGELFASAFGDSAVTSDRIARALAQFVRSMLSYQSKFDQGVATNFANFTAEENLGRQLFNSPRGRCNTCHSGPNFVGIRIENNGLEFPFIDEGAGGVTGRVQDNGKFKMPSLRNIEVTGPYMHDGRFATLEEVIDHYSTGVVANPNLGPSLQAGPPGGGGGGGGPGGGGGVVARRPDFTAAEKEALIAFLKTLTDESFLTDPKYADPFRK